MAWVCIYGISASAKALYPALNCMEVALRNSLHIAISDKFKNPRWFMAIPPILGPREVESVAKAIESIPPTKRAASPIPAPGRIIAELSLGFWGALFYPYYDQTFWPALLRPVFPHMPPRGRTRLALFERIDQHRWLRNRVFHYEPIWKDPKLPDYHQQLIETIGWIRPEIRDVTLAIDRFADVWQRGPTIYRAALEALLIANEELQ